MKLSIYSNDLELNHPFSISRQTYYHQPEVLVELELDGVKGYGEATANPYYHISSENLKASLAGIQKKLKNYQFIDPDACWNDFSFLMDTNTFAMCALNNAAWDLYGKMIGEPVSRIIGTENAKPILTSLTIGIDSMKNMLHKMDEIPWPVYKIKLGTDRDMEIMKNIRRHSKSSLRVDANCAWTAEKTLEYADILKSLNVDFIEQPLPVENNGAMMLVKGKSALPIFADESCRTEQDVANCVRYFHGINIKLQKCGGLSPALRMIDKARKLNLNIMIGCMTETSVGIAAAAQLLPLVDYADLDGPLLIKKDIAEGLTFSDGKISVSPAPGLGINIIHCQNEK